jgi:uncharacterized protein YbaR (Trm112 family)
LESILYRFDSEPGWMGLRAAAVARSRPVCYSEGAEKQRSKSPMSISQELLEILVCPLCKAPVRLKPDNSGLKCEKCHRVYPVKDDIPVMLVDEATIENA